MYLDASLQQRRHFSSFVASVDGLLGVEATATLKMLASCLATKWKQSYSKTCGYVKSRIVITLVRATHRCIRGSRVLAHLSQRVTTSSVTEYQTYPAKPSPPPTYATTPSYIQVAP